MLDFATLGCDFFSNIDTQPLKQPFLIHKNQALQDRLKLSIKDNELLNIASGEKKFQHETFA